MEENEPIVETNENNEQIEDDVPDEIFDEDFSKTESLSISLSKEGEDVTISEPTEIKEEIIGNFVNKNFLGPFQKFEKKSHVNSEHNSARDLR